MVRKSLGYIVLITVLLVGKQSFAMHQLVFRGAKVIGSGAVPCLTAYSAHKKYQDYEKFQDNLDKCGNFRMALSEQSREFFFPFGDDTPMPKRVEEFAKKRMEKVGVPRAQSMPMSTQIIVKDWAATYDRVLLAGEKSLNELDKALSDNDKKVIARHNIILTHEASHVINEDVKKFILVGPVVASGLQMVSSTMSYAFNKTCGIENPKTWLRTLARSSMAIGSIVPKLGLTGIGIIAYQRHREAMADKFACENAETRLELEEFRDFFREHEDILKKHAPALHPSIEQNEVNQQRWLRLVAFNKDHVHPYPSDRADMVQKYIDNWDAEHKEV